MQPFYACNPSLCKTGMVETKAREKSLCYESGNLPGSTKSSKNRTVEVIHYLPCKSSLKKTIDAYHELISPNTTFSPEIKYPFGALSLHAGLKMNFGTSPLTFVAVKNDRQGYYARLNLGYGFPANSDIFNNYITTVGMGSGGAGTNEVIKTTLGYIAFYSGGNGFNAGIGAGYMLNNNIGFDLGLNEVISSTLQSPATTYNPGKNSISFYSFSSQYGNMFQVNPSIELSTNIWRFTPYTR